MSFVKQFGMMKNEIITHNEKRKTYLESMKVKLKLKRTEHNG